MKQISCESGLSASGEAELVRHLADLGLGAAAEREERAGELLLRQSEEEVGLVLGSIGGALEDPAAALRVVLVAGVVAGGDAVGADLARGDEQLIELQMVVAERAGDGRASGEILVDEGADDVALEALLLVDDVVGDVEVLGDAAGVVDVVDASSSGPARCSGMPSLPARRRWFQSCRVRPTSS